MSLDGRPISRSPRLPNPNNSIIITTLAQHHVFNSRHPSHRVRSVILLSLLVPVLFYLHSPTLVISSLPSSTPADILRAMSTCGFIHLSLEGTPLSIQDVRHAFSLSHKLFDDLPLSARLSCPQDSDYNGHTAVGMSKLAAEHGQKLPDHKEGFGYGRFDPPRTSTFTTHVSRYGDVN